MELLQDGSRTIMCCMGAWGNISLNQLSIMLF